MSDRREPEQADVSIREPVGSAAEPTAPQAVGKYAKLPERIRFEEMTTEQPAADPGDPTFGGRDPERDWLLRSAG